MKTILLSIVLIAALAYQAEGQRFTWSDSLNAATMVDTSITDTVVFAPSWTGPNVNFGGQGSCEVEYAGLDADASTFYVGGTNMVGDSVLTFHPFVDDSIPKVLATTAYQVVNGDTSTVYSWTWANQPYLRVGVRWVLNGVTSGSIHWVIKNR